MKKLVTTIAISIFAFVGTAVQADARPWNGAYRVGTSETYLSCYQNGRPVYVEKTYIGHDSCGIPRFKYRNIPTQSQHRGHNSDRRRQSHSRNYDRRGHDRYRSGTSASSRFGR